MHAMIILTYLHVPCTTCACQVAGSLAIAAALDQRQHLGGLRAEHIRQVLADAMHQAKNPLTALRTFTKVLLRRLRGDNSINRCVHIMHLTYPVGIIIESLLTVDAIPCRQLVKDIVLQSDRLIDLLRPVDSIIGLLSQAAESPPLPRLMAGNHHDQFIGNKQKDWASPSPTEQQQNDSHLPEVSLVYVTDAIEPMLRAAEVSKLVCMHQI